MCIASFLLSNEFIGQNMKFVFQLNQFQANNQINHLFSPCQCAVCGADIVFDSVGLPLIYAWYIIWLLVCSTTIEHKQSQKNVNNSLKKRHTCTQQFQILINKKKIKVQMRVYILCWFWFVFLDSPYFCVCSKSWPRGTHIPSRLLCEIPKHTL